MLASRNIAILKSKLSHIRWCNDLISLGYKTCIGLIYLGFQGIILNITLLYQPSGKKKSLAIKTAPPYHLSLAPQHALIFSISVPISLPI